MHEISNTAIAAKPRMPKSIWFILGSEFTERLSYFGMRAILPLFMATQFFNQQGTESLTAEASARVNVYMHAFSTLVYFTPLLGAIMADWFFGKYRVILIGSIVYTLGHLLLSLFNHDLSGFTVGLVVIAIAAGCIKSCVAANVGDQFDDTNKELISRGYGWFYFCINSGTTVSMLLFPVVMANFGAAWAFGIPGILMAIAAVIFFAGNKRYVKAPPKGINKGNFFVLNGYILSRIFKGNKWKAALLQTEAKFGAAKVSGLRAVWRVMAVFAFMPIFWGMYDMNQSEWVLQAAKLDLDLGIFGIKALAAQVQSAGTILILLLIPVFTYVIYPLVEKLGIKLTPLRKIGAGLFTTALSFVIIALLETQVQAGHHPSVWWQILAYVVLSAAEVMVAITCLEFAYTQSPPSLKSTMTALWFFTYSLGTLFTTWVNASIASRGVFRNFTGARYYWLFVGIMLGFTLLFVLVSPFMKEKNYLADNSTDTNVDEQLTEK